MILWLYKACGTTTLVTLEASAVPKLEASAVPKQAQAKGAAAWLTTDYQNHIFCRFLSSGPIFT